MVKITEERLKKANAIKPIEFYKPIKDINDVETSKFYITDQCNVYYQKDIDEHDYLCESKPKHVQNHDGRLYGYLPYETDVYMSQPLPRVLLRTFDTEHTVYNEEFFKTHEANHINPDRPLENSIYNLEWVTPEENMYKAGETGVMVKKYDKALIHKICQMICDGYSRQDIKRELFVDVSLIDDIRSGRSHRSVSSQYLDKGFEYNVNDREEKRARAEQICKLIVEGYRSCEIVRMLDLPNSLVVSDIKHKRAYVYISDKYF